MLVIRRVTFYLFLIAYIVICPLTILHAFGYTVEPGSRQGLIKTGLMYLATDPPGASIYLGKRRYTKTTPATLPGLLPGEYPVRLSLKGYRSWEQVVPIEAEKATALDRVLLIPSQLEPKIIADEAFEELIAIPGNRAFLLAKGLHLSDMTVFDGKSQKSWPLIAADSALASAKAASWFTVPESPRLLVRAETWDGEEWLWFEPQRSEAPVERLTNLFFERPSTVDWEAHNDRYLFAFQKGYINRFDTASAAASPKWQEHVRGLGLHGRLVYVMKDDGTLFKMDRDGRSEEPMMRLPVSQEMFFEQREFFRIYAAGSEMVLLGDRGELLASRAPYTLADKGVLGVDWDSHRRRMLFWQKDKVDVIDFSRQEEAAQPSVQIRPVYKGRNIQQALWIDEGSYILLRDDDRLLLAGVDTYGAAHIETLMDVKKNSAVAYLEDSGVVYYLDAASGYLTALRLLPRRELLGMSLGDQ